MAKVKKIDAPIFVIGLGGTGFDTLMRIKHDFSTRFETEQYADGSFADKPARTEFLEIDTDFSIAGKRKNGVTLREDEFLYIGANLKAIHTAMQNKPYISEWVDPSISTLDVDGDGAGACRQVSRLFLFNKIEDIISRLSGKLSTLNNVAAGAAAKSSVIQVKLIAGISGGTGSGTLLDTAYILRHLAETMPCQINIEAYLVMPDVTVAHVAKNDPDKTKIYRTNSYGLLKELDYWMNAVDTGITMNQQYSEGRTITWKGLPFDDVHLLCAQNDQGVAIAEAYEHNIGVISEYLVHCYESTDEQGNENYSVENEKDGGTSNVSNSFSFQSARSNQRAIINLKKQPYPVPYRYHSLGAFSNAGENRMMELKQWDMIYEEAVTRIEKHPVQMDGAAPVAFQKTVLDFANVTPTSAGSVRKEYNLRHIPPMLDADVYSMDTLKNEDESAAPHSMTYEAFSTGIRQSHGDEELNLTDAVWNVFEAEARTVGEDIERGPEYLLDLLRKGPNSISVQLDQTIQEITNKYNYADNMTGTHKQQCSSKFVTFKDCGVIEGLFKKKAYYDAYMTEVRALYDATRAAGYYKALITALKNFKNKLARYIAVLSDLVTAIKSQQKDIKQQLEHIDVSSTLFDVNAMNANLTQLFNDQAKRDTFVQAMYRNTINVSMVCMKDTIPTDQLPELLDNAINGLRENQFIAVGGMSLTQKISAYENVAVGQSMQQYVKNTLCPRLTSGAEVMFNATTEAAGLPEDIAARTSLVSVPAGEQDIIDGIRQYCDAQNMTVIIKLIQNSDRIFWVNDKGGMPMYFYNQLDMLREDYLKTKNQHKGYQLFMGNTNALNAAGLKDEMKQNWAEILPDPKIDRQFREVGEKAETLKAAEEAGVLVIEYDYHIEDAAANPTVTYSKNVFNKIGGLTVSETTIKNAIGAGVDVTEELKLPAVPSSRAALNAAIEKLNAYKAELEALRANRSSANLNVGHLEHKAKAWGDIFGVHNRMIALSADMDEVTSAQVKDAWKMSYDRAIREALGWRPDLLAELKLNTTCVQLIDERIAKVVADIEALEKIEKDIGDEADPKIAAGAAALMLYKQIEVYPAKVVMHMDDDEDEEADNTLFDSTSDVERLVDMFEDFGSLPFLLRFAAWYTVNGASSRKCKALVEIKDRKAKKIANKRRADADVKEVYDYALEVAADIKAASKKLNRLYLDEKISEELNDYAKKMVRAMSNELDSFISTWEEALEDFEG